MPPEEVPDLDPKIAGIVERTFQKVREEMLQKLQEARAEVEELTRKAEAARPVPAAVAAEAPRAAELGPDVASLKQAAARIDAGRSQKDVLGNLLAETAGLASRAALFLTRGDSVEGWAGHGFGDSDERLLGLRREYGESGAWSRLAAGRGAVRLSAEECADLCREIDGSEPAEGLLVPFILGGQVAAGLYADRLADDPPLPHDAIQLLTLIGSQTVQCLPLRERPATATLRYAEEAPAEEPGLPLWQAGAAAAAAAAMAVPAAEPRVTPPVEVEEVPEEIPALEEQPEEALEIGEPVEVEAEEEEVALETEIEEAPVDLEPVEASGFEVELAEEPAFGPVPEIPEPEEEEAELLTAPPELAVSAEPEMEEPVLEVEELPEVGEPLEVEEPLGVEEPPEAEPAPAAVMSPVEPRFVEPPTPAPVAPIEAPPAPPPAPAEAPPAEEKAEIPGGTEIAPPPDLEGPGWAFTTTRISREATDEAIHEEARRLARLLVTEIKLYNEEQVDQGRQNRDVYSRLKEDIDRSRQIFEERIDEKVRRTTDYFHEELVRVLCGGDPQLLGV